MSLTFVSRLSLPYGSGEALFRTLSTAASFQVSFVTMIFSLATGESAAVLDEVYTTLLTFGSVLAALRTLSVPFTVGGMTASGSELNVTTEARCTMPLTFLTASM